MDKKSAVNFFNEIAQKWDSMENPVFASRIPLHIQKVNINTGDKVADIGCGTGILYPHLKAAQAGEILCVDISQNMLLELSKKYPGAQTLTADFEEDALPQNYFDKVIVHNAFPHFSNRLKAVQKAYGMLKEGGGFYIIQSLTRKELANVHGGKKETKKDAVPLQEEIKDIFTKAGFKDILLQEDKNGCFFAAFK